MIYEGLHWEHHNRQKIHSTDLSTLYALKFLKERPKNKPFALTVAFYPPKAIGGYTEPGGQWFPTNETKKMYENVTIPQPEMKKSFEALPFFLKGERNEALLRFNQRYSSPEHYQAAMRNYFALVSGVDEACRKIVNQLKEDGLYQNTMVIFTTDNGLFHGAHGLAGKYRLFFLRPF